MANAYLAIAHPFEPVFDEHAHTLVLGTFPSVLSRENAFYYGHPQNRFWKVIASVCHDGLPDGIEEKKLFLKMNHLLFRRLEVWKMLRSLRKRT